MDNLEAHGIAEDTVILFMSDNGSGFPGLPINAPLRDRKGSGYEGGIRVPLIVSGPEYITAGSINHSNVIVEDLYPTILAMAGAEIPADYQPYVDGRDITPLLAGSERFDSDRAIYFHQPHQHNGAPFSAVVQGEWKLIFWHETESLALYNLAEDIGETNNLASVNVVMANQLLSSLAEYLTVVDAQFPTFRSDGRLVELPGPSELLGDLTGDGQINIDDWLAFRAALNTTIAAETIEEGQTTG